MLTQYDKALIPVLAGVLGWLNQKYGFKFDTTPETLSVVITAIASVVVYFVPNKEAKA